jgi:ketosteroid isomerase-like protein
MQLLDFEALRSRQAQAEAIRSASARATPVVSVGCASEPRLNPSMSCMLSRCFGSVIGGRSLAQSNLKIFKSIVERGFSGGDLSVADEVCAERLLEHEYLAQTDLPGPDILKSQIKDARKSIKNLKLTLEAAVQTEDTVWARCRARGNDPHSGKPVAIDVVDICRFSDGKLVEHWGVPDRFALLHQIGALPSPK